MYCRIITKWNKVAFVICNLYICDLMYLLLKFCLLEERILQFLNVMGRVICQPILLKTIYRVQRGKSVFEFLYFDKSADHDVIQKIPSLGATQIIRDTRRGGWGLMKCGFVLVSEQISIQKTLFYNLFHNSHPMSLENSHF